MSVKIRELLIITAILLVLVIPSAAMAQHKHAQSGQPKASMAGTQSEMSKKMMKSPHHMLMTAHMKSMSEFARALRTQAMKPEAMDVEFARAAVAELRHTLDAIEAVHQQHMQAMSIEMKSKMEAMNAEMKSKMQMMMGMCCATLKDQVSALEADVQTSTPDNKQVLADTNALLKHLGMMSTMNGRSKAAKKKMEMKKM